MELKELLSAKTTFVGLKAADKTEVIKDLCARLVKAGATRKPAALAKEMLAREKTVSTGIGEGVGIPHAQSANVIHSAVAVARLARPVPWDGIDGEPVDVVFMIALSQDKAAAQIDILQQLARMMGDKKLLAGLRKAEDGAQAHELVLAALSRLEQEDAAQTPGATEANVEKAAKRIVAVTACPTGIAHTYLAADALRKAGQELGYDIKVETQGRSIENDLTQADVDRADAIILAIDKGIDGMERFAGRNVLTVGAKAAIKDAAGLIQKALAGEGKVQGGSKGGGGSFQPTELQWSNFKNVYKNIMGGVSRMLPFVVAGGILLGIGFLIDSGITGGNLGVTREAARWFAGIGKTSFGIFVAILGGFVAYSIVGVEGLLPGILAGLIANGGGLLYGVGDKGALITTGWGNLWGGLTTSVDQSVLANGSGFIGAMVGGYVAAVGVMVLRKHVFFKVRPAFAGIVSIIGVPVLSTLFIAAFMFAAQIPLAYLSYGLRLGLQELNKLNLSVILGIIMGIMAATDFGGPINKVAYVFSTGLIGQTGAGSVEFRVMGMNMAANMVPPIAIAIATIMARKRWTDEEFSAGQSCWVMGGFMITEGAIPFAAKDPKRVIPCLMVGSAVAAAIAGALQIGNSAPHGGVFVFALLRSYLFDDGAVQTGTGVAFMIGALALGALVAAALINLTGTERFQNWLKRNHRGAADQKQRVPFGVKIRASWQKTRAALTKDRTPLAENCVLNEGAFKNRRASRYNWAAA